MHGAIVVVGVVSLAIVTSQLRRLMASQSVMEVESVDSELMALSAKHQVSQFPNGAAALILSIFAVLGGVVFSSDVQDAQEEEAAEPSVSEPSKEVAKVKCDEQQSEAQSPAMRRCTPFHLEGLMHGAIVVIGVVSLALVTSQLRGVMASQSVMEVQGVDNELMALSAKHQVSQFPNGAAALILSIFAVLGGV